MNDLRNAFSNQPLSLTATSALRQDLRNYALQNLPQAMVPSRFVVVGQLPKLPNGKVDRKRLLQEAQTLQDVEGTPQNTHQPPTTPEEVQVAHIWKDLLGTQQIGIEESFFSVGGNSLTAVQMAARIREAFGVAISLRELFEAPTIREIALRLGTGSQQVLDQARERSVTPEMLLRESTLPDDIQITEGLKPAVQGLPGTVLLTGGTGYTGAFLLRALLDRSEARVFVLVRADSDQHAFERVRQNLQSFDLWRPQDETRVLAVAGDLGRAYFGLGRSTYERLAEEVEMIVHNGALSNYAQTYTYLKPINVLGTVEVLRLACRQRIKPVHFVSSLAVFPVRKGQERFPEAPLSDPFGVIGGYQQTKWVADRLVTEAGKRGLPINVYRPGQITGAQQGGQASTDTFLNAMLKGCIQLGKAMHFDVTLEMVPVDVCAAVISHLALGGQHHGKVFHLTNPRQVHWHDVVQMIQACGYPLKHTDYLEWYGSLTSALQQGEENELARYLVLFGDQAPSPDLGESGSAPVYLTGQLQDALQGSGIHCEPMGVALMQTYLKYFESTGFLPARTGEDADAALSLV
ncbi:thioester reductase domain-containing protein [Deinococcus cellulosilyticus]|uniref:Carrier domain-containing protein n=1 Tax=Deinococcus cellulosilyticus (strain DSM 18568 / NBRC 106333 / KACC 11606 / 5516J-15) TaxID=1223518 RepID=A0A511N1Z7_DEIC1|nr:thioester reductase domain-containing protein [Deinococcus cellulosilyticus]GEM46882.1 hypothetical protein DC3_25170 [Deinococcus cellulosilyticus NBRC 106333 = KACC 11606]